MVVKEEITTPIFNKMIDKSVTPAYYMYMHGNSDRSESSVNPQSPIFCLNANLRKAARVILSLYMEELRSSGLQGTQFTLLFLLKAVGQAQIGDIARMMQMDQTTVTRNIDLLKKGGFVEVVKGEKDRRTRMAQLTDKGGEAVNEAYPLWLKAQNKIWDELGDEKAKQLLELTEEIAQLGRTSE